MCMPSSTAPSAYDSAAIDGGFNSASGWFLALGIAGLGTLVLLFGLILISLAYRLEDSRLMQVYQELQDVWLNQSAQIADRL